MTRTIKIKPEWMKTELLNMQRWEDEGGQMVEVERPINPGRFVRPMLKTAGTPDLPRQWSRKFTIERFRAGAGFGFSKKDAANPK